MSRHITMTEAQFKNYMRVMLNESELKQDSERELSIEETQMLLHRMIDNDFLCYFSNGNKITCSYLKDKSEIIASACSMTPILKTNGNIGLFHRQYGYFEIDNLLN